MVPISELRVIALRCGLPGCHDPRNGWGVRQDDRLRTELPLFGRNSWCHPGRACKKDSDRAPVRTRERALAGHVSLASVPSQLNKAPCPHIRCGRDPTAQAGPQPRRKASLCQNNPRATGPFCPKMSSRLSAWDRDTVRPRGQYRSSSVSNSRSTSYYATRTPPAIRGTCSTALWPTRAPRSGAGPRSLPFTRSPSRRMWLPTSVAHGAGAHRRVRCGRERPAHQAGQGAAALRAR